MTIAELIKKLQACNEGVEVNFAYMDADGDTFPLYSPSVYVVGTGGASGESVTIELRESESDPSESYIPD